jgi:chromosome segregation ATPase
MSDKTTYDKEMREFFRNAIKDIKREIKLSRDNTKSLVEQLNDYKGKIAQLTTNIKKSQPPAKPRKKFTAQQRENNKLERELNRAAKAVIKESAKPKKLSGFITEGSTRYKASQK